MVNAVCKAEQPGREPTGGCSHRFTGAEEVQFDNSMETRNGVRLGDDCNRRMANYFLNRSSNALRALLGRLEVNPPEAGADETATAVGAVSFSIVVRGA